MDKYEVLQKYYGYDDFRGIQAEVIDCLLAKKQVLAIMATGLGKSLCFQISGLLLEGVTIVISPLISLIVDQVKSLRKKQITAAFLLGDMTYIEIQKVYQSLVNEQLKFLYLAPERLMNEGFLAVIQKVKVAQVIVDEAHSISMWGNDFRPSYQKIPLFLNYLNQDCNLAFFTATANDLVIKDIKKLLKLNDLEILKTNSDRKNLYYGVVKPKIKFAYLMKFLLKHQNGKGIIYTLTRKETEEIYQKLFDYHFSVTYFHGGMEMHDKKRNQLAFSSGDKNIMVATNAFGMGIDIPDIRYVVLYTLPLSLADLSQEFGRCSRDGAFGECVVLYDSKDIKKCLYFFDDDKKKLKEFRKVVQFCEDKECLHASLIEYFDHEKSEKCMNCSNCLRHKKQ